MLTATVTHLGGLTAVTVHYPHSVGVTGTTGSSTEEKPGPSPIVPELKELVWTSGAFVVFAVLMRYWLYPRLRKGMDARYNTIRTDHESADATRAAAMAEVAEYASELAVVKAQAVARTDVARRTLESERAERLAVVNGEIAALRGAASVQADEARAAVQGQIESAVTDVASRAIELAIGKSPAADVVRRVVVEVMSVGVTR